MSGEVAGGAWKFPTVNGKDAGGARKFPTMSGEIVGGAWRVFGKIRTWLRSGPWRSGRHSDRNSGDISDVKM